MMHWPGHYVKIHRNGQKVKPITGKRDKRWVRGRKKGRRRLQSLFISIFLVVPDTPLQAGNFRRPFPLWEASFLQKSLTTKKILLHHLLIAFMHENALGGHRNPQSRCWPISLWGRKYYLYSFQMDTWIITPCVPSILLMVVDFIS